MDIFDIARLSFSGISSLCGCHIAKYDCRKSLHDWPRDPRAGILSLTTPSIFLIEKKRFEDLIAATTPTKVFTINQLQSVF